jgi:hypothetical protein
MLVERDNLLELRVHSEVRCLAATMTGWRRTTAKGIAETSERAKALSAEQSEADRTACILDDALQSIKRRLDTEVETYIGSVYRRHSMDLSRITEDITSDLDHLVQDWYNYATIRLRRAAEEMKVTLANSTELSFSQLQLKANPQVASEAGANEQEPGASALAMLQTARELLAAACDAIAGMPIERAAEQLDILAKSGTFHEYKRLTGRSPYGIRMAGHGKRIANAVFVHRLGETLIPFAGEAYEVWRQIRLAAKSEEDKHLQIKALKERIATEVQQTVRLNYDEWRIGSGATVLEDLVSARKDGVAGALTECRNRSDNLKQLACDLDVCLEDVAPRHIEPTHT